MKWRIIPFEYNTAFMNMAIDNSLMESVKKTGQPVIRFYGWLPSAVSIGYFQSMKQEVNGKKCSSLGINIVRRITGGGSVYHSNDGEITYSVIAPESIFPKNIIESYKEICGWVIEGLVKVGIMAEFKPINDIIVGNKKISGNAQTRKEGILLQHGTILYDVDVERMFSVLNVPDEKIKDKLISSVKERVTRILDFKCISKEEILNELIEAFKKEKEFEFSELSEEELERAKELAEKKYKTEKWNYMK